MLLNSTDRRAVSIQKGFSQIHAMQTKAAHSTETNGWINKMQLMMGMVVVDGRPVLCLTSES